MTEQEAPGHQSNLGLCKIKGCKTAGLVAVRLVITIIWFAMSSVVAHAWCLAVLAKYLSP